MVPVDFAPDQDASLVSGLLQEPLQSLELAGVHDAGQLVGLKGLRAIHGCSCALHGLQQGLLEMGLHQQVVRCNAGLSGVQAFAPDQSAGAHLEVSPIHHQRRAFSTKFQGDRREVGSSTLQNASADGPATCEKDVVEGQRHQCGGDGAIPLYHPHHVGLEVFRHQSADQRGDRWCLFGWFQHSGVAGCQGADQWLQGQRERIVPGPDDQHAAEGFRDDVRPSGALRQGNRNPSRLHPAAQVGARQFQFLAQGHHLEERFGGRFAEVLGQSLQNLLLVAFHQGLQPLQLSETPGHRPGFPSPHAVLHQAELFDGQGHRADDQARRV